MEAQKLCKWGEFLGQENLKRSGQFFPKNIKIEAPFYVIVYVLGWIPQGCQNEAVKIGLLQGGLILMWYIDMGMYR